MSTHLADQENYEKARYEVIKVTLEKKKICFSVKRQGYTRKTKQLQKTLKFFALESKVSLATTNALEYNKLY